MSMIRGSLNATNSDKTGQVSLAHNGSGVSDKTTFLASTSCVKGFRSKIKAMNFQGLHWLQTLGFGKASFEAKCCNRQVRSTLGQHSYDTLLTPFYQVVVLVPNQEDTKTKTVLTLNILINYQVSNRTCN